MKKIIDTEKQGRWLFYACIVLIPVFGYSQPDIPIDASLKNNSESWKVKTRQKSFVRYKPAEVFFGPIKTVRTDAEKPQQLNREVSRELFWKDIKTVNSRESSIQLTYDDADTAIVNMLVVTVDEIHKRNTTGVFFNADKNKDETMAATSWVDEMIISSQKDTTQWRYTKTDSADFKLSGYIGKLQSAKDSFFVKPIDNLTGKKMKDMLFSQPATGFIFLHEGKQTAALQLIMKRKAWVTKDIEPSAREAILVTMTVLLATTKDESVE